MGWLLSPILSFLVNKFFANLSFDTSRKLRKLEIDTIPSLKETLTKVEEQRMVEAVKGKGSESNLVTLKKIENDLKSILYEAEDTLDLVDYHRIEKKVKGTTAPAGSQGLLALASPAARGPGCSGDA